MLLNLNNKNKKNYILFFCPNTTTASDTQFLFFLFFVCFKDNVMCLKIIIFTYLCAAYGW